MSFLLLPRVLLLILMVALLGQLLVEGMTGLWSESESGRWHLEFKLCEYDTDRSQVAIAITLPLLG